MVQDATTALETLVDRYGLANVVETLAMVCELKADHIDQNVSLNRALWTLAERMAELKAA